MTYNNEESRVRTQIFRYVNKDTHGDGAASQANESVYVLENYTKDAELVGDGRIVRSANRFAALDLAR